MGIIGLIKNINRTPKVSLYKGHYFCDYIELIALVNNQDVVSRSDIYDRFYDDDRIILDKNEDSETFDKWEITINEWFLLLINREDVFNDFYPFIVTETTIKLKSKITNKHKLYIFLLLNSNQRYLNKNKIILSSDFEEISLIALKNYLPSHGLSYRFGKSMLNYDRYRGSLKSKIDLLADDLKYRIQYDEDDFNTNDNGDGGLDLVSWIPFFNDSNQNNMQVVLSQCATGKEWFTKQYETDKFTSNFINFRTKVNGAIFIPYDGRKFDRKFTEQKEILNDIWLFDRIRILNLLKENENDVFSLKSFEKVVEKIIEYQEDII